MFDTRALRLLSWQCVTYSVAMIRLLFLTLFFVLFSLVCLKVVSYADSEALLDCIAILLLFLRLFRLTDAFL